MRGEKAGLLGNGDGLTFFFVSGSVILDHVFSSVQRCSSSIKLRQAEAYKLCKAREL